MYEILYIAILGALGSIGWHLNSEADNRDITALLGHTIAGAIVALIVILLFFEHTIGTREGFAIALILGWVGPESIESLVKYLKNKYYPILPIGGE